MDARRPAHGRVITSAARRVGMSRKSYWYEVNQLGEQNTSDGNKKEQRKCQK